MAVAEVGPTLITSCAAQGKGGIQDRWRPTGCVWEHLATDAKGWPLPKHLDHAGRRQLQSWRLAAGIRLLPSLHDLGADVHD